MNDTVKEQVNNTKHRKGVRAAAVILLIAALLFSVWFMQTFMCIPFSCDEIRIINFHKEPENSIDVLLIGSSATYSDFSSAYAYEKYGYTSFPYAIGGSTCTMWKPALKDALKTQKPKLVVVDVFGGGYTRDMIDSRSNQLSIVFSHTAFSPELIESAAEASALTEQSSTAGFIFPFIKYHNNVPACLPDLPDRLKLAVSGPSPLKGVFTNTRAHFLADVDPASFTDESAPIDEKTEAIIVDFIEYCKSEDIEVLFAKYPSVLTEDRPDEMQVNLRANRILEIAREHGYATINMQKQFYDIGLDEAGDFYNHGHTNTRGQKKVTEFLGKYLQQEMGIGPSDLSSDLRSEWETSVWYYHEYVKNADDMIEKDRQDEYYDSPKVVYELANGIKRP